MTHDNTEGIISKGIPTCPYCGKTMERGELPNEVHPYWIPEGKSLPPISGIIPSGAVKLKINQNEELFYQRAEAYYCPNCKIIIAHTI